MFSRHSVAESKCSKCGSHIIVRSETKKEVGWKWLFVWFVLLLWGIVLGAPKKCHAAEIAPKFEGIIIHHTATPNGKEYSLDQCNRDHRARGFESCGYSALFEPNGDIIESRGYGRIGAHARGYNSRFLGVAIVGTGDINDHQLEALRLYIRETERLFGKMRLLGHRDVGRTECPGNDLYQKITSGMVR